jgi:hypothetical protein
MGPKVFLYNLATHSPGHPAPPPPQYPFIACTVLQTRYWDSRTIYTLIPPNLPTAISLSVPIFLFIPLFLHVSLLLPLYLCLIAPSLKRNLCILLFTAYWVSVTGFPQELEQRLMFSHEVIQTFTQSVLSHNRLSCG